MIEYAFGSGRHATTFLSLLDRDPSRPTGREHRLTEFAHSAALDVTPGQFLTGHASGNTDRGRILSTENTLICFGCHTTATSDRGPKVLDEATMIPNVTCERCHGPARSHVEAARRGAVDLHIPAGLETWTVEEQLRRCGACHRTPEMVKPGSIRTDNPVLVRHQPVALVQSACFKSSGNTLGCNTCHDPHARASTDRPAYEATCRSCHGDRRVADCPVSTRSGCLDCHMPRREVARGMIMTDHWIRIIPGLGPPPRTTQDPAERPGERPLRSGRERPGATRCATTHSSAGNRGSGIANPACREMRPRRKFPRRRTRRHGRPNPHDASMGTGMSARLITAIARDRLLKNS